jgi:hypothetical protein
MIGTAIRKTEPHQKYCSIIPPITGPIAPPAEKLAIHTLIAKVRSRSSGNMFEMSESVDGASVAPAIPSSARATIKSSAVGAKAARMEVSPKQTAPISSSFRRPIRSPRVPIVSSIPAIRKP